MAKTLDTRLTPKQIKRLVDDNLHIGDKVIIPKIKENAQRYVGEAIVKGIYPHIVLFETPKKMRFCLTNIDCLFINKPGDKNYGLGYRDEDAEMNLLMRFQIMIFSLENENDIIDMV